MKKTILTLALTATLLATLFAIATIASAAETYSAQDADPGNQPAESAQAETNSPAPTLPPPPCSVAPKENKPLQAPFDQVPGDQINPISKRLKIVEEIVRKHKRAYDYRALTTRELEAILSRLDAQKTEQKSE